MTQFVSQITELKQQVAALQIERDRALRSKEQSQHDMESLQSRYQSLQQDSLETTGSLNLLKTKSTQILNEHIRIQSLWVMMTVFNDIGRMIKFVILKVNCHPLNKLLKR